MAHRAGRAPRRAPRCAPRRRRASSRRRRSVPDGEGSLRNRTGRRAARSPPRPPAPRSAPGRRSRWRPPATAAATSRLPGSDTSGVPASLTTATVRPRPDAPSTASRRATSLWPCRDSSLTPLHPGVGEQSPGAPGVLAAHDVGLPELWTARGDRSPRFPIGCRQRATQRSRRDGQSGTADRGARGLSPSADPSARRHPPRPRGRSGPASGAGTCATGRAPIVDHDAQVTVEERDVDGEAHAEAVAPTGSEAG